MTWLFKIVIQARMSSSRFPGKVLAPFRGKPLIAHLVERITEQISSDHIIVATSTEKTDDPLAFYMQKMGINVFRGPLDDVFLRLRLCLNENPCDWFFRISADSPLLNPKIMTTMMSFVGSGIDLVTNVQKRTFPHGQSVELLNVGTFSRINPALLSDNDREHGTGYYYAHPAEFRIMNIENTDPAYSKLNFVVDTLEDLRRMEQMEYTNAINLVPQMVKTG